MITDVADYFTKGCGRCARFGTSDCATQLWPEPLAALRALCREADLSETVKWGHPCYMHAGRNVAILGATRDGARLSFFEAGLLDDPEGLLERQGPQTPHPDAVHFDGPAAVAARASALRDLIAQARAHAEAGLRVPRPEGAPDLPEELAEALEADPALAEAFHRLTPGRQRSHALHVAAARAPATRAARAARLAPRILAGKGATER